jgi:hypothetical protein
MVEDEEIQERRKRRWWIGGTLAAAAVAAGLWLGLPHATEFNSMRNWFPGAQKTVESLGTRMTKLESDARNWVAERAIVKEALPKLQHDLAAKMQLTQKYAKELNDKLYARLSTDIDARASEAAARINRLEQAERAGGRQVAVLEAELARINHELKQHESRFAASEANQHQDKQMLARDVSSLGQRIDDNRNALQTLENGLTVQQVDFELSRNRSKEIVEGLSLCVTNIDIARRQVKGWMWIMPDRKTIWVRNHGALRPLIFYTESDEKPREVVFTRMTKDSVVGYVLLPGTASATSAKEGMRVRSRGNS